MTLTAGTRIGPYEITSTLGEGGMGVVYRATDTNLKRQVAVKVLPASLAEDRDRLARFQREAELLASLNHPHIAQLYGVEGGALVMELVEGPTLAERIAQGALALDEALPIAMQITDALSAAHERGIVHRDLKPANIKVRPDGTVKVLDFGLAKTAEPAVAAAAGLSLSPTMTSPAMTEAGMLLGTAPYMSPEQARGKVVDKRADIWAFGCVLFEMVTGRRSFGGDDVTETIAAIIRDQPDLSLAPPPLRRLLARCLEKDPRRRLRDIGDVWALLDDAAPVRLAVPAAPIWRRAVPWSFAMAAAIAAVAVSVVHFSETRAVPRVIRFRLQIPEEAGSATPTMSPDGTRLAYRLGGQIWVRDLADSEQPRAIASTDRPVGRMFWSADSRFVVYAAAGKLMRAPAAGGPQQAIRDQLVLLAAGFGLPDGGVVVTSGVSVTPGGGETVRIDSHGSRPLAGISGISISGGASLLPDGRRFVFPVSEPEARRGVYAASIDGVTAPERLLPDVSEVAYVPSVNRRGEGYLLLLRQGALIALPVDAARLQPRGEPIELATGVRSFTASVNDSFVYRAGTGRRLTWHDRRGTPTGTAWSPGPYNEIALSPDAARVLVVRADGPTTWVHEFAREASTRLGSSLGVAYKPLWSPNGDVLALSSRTGASEFYRLATDGAGGTNLVFRSSAVAYPTSWSRDGAWLMYTSVDPRTKDDLWVLPTPATGIGTPEPFLVTDNRETAGMFSPDGRAVAYVSDEGGTNNVFVRSFPNSGGHKWQVSTTGGYQPRWRGDGKELFYMSATGQLMRVDVTPGLASSPGTPTVLFQTAVFGGGASVNNWYWDLTADGQRFLVNEVIGDADPSTLHVVLNWQAGLPR